MVSPRHFQPRGKRGRSSSGRTQPGRLCGRSVAQQWAGQSSEDARRRSAGGRGERGGRPGSASAAGTSIRTGSGTGDTGAAGRGPRPGSASPVLATRALRSPVEVVSVLSVAVQTDGPASSALAAPAATSLPRPPWALPTPPSPPRRPAGPARAQPARPAAEAPASAQPGKAASLQRPRASCIPVFLAPGAVSALSSLLRQRDRPLSSFQRNSGLWVEFSECIRHRADLTRKFVVRCVG